MIKSVIIAIVISCIAIGAIIWIQNTQTPVANITFACSVASLLFAALGQLDRPPRHSSPRYEGTRERAIVRHRVTAVLIAAIVTIDATIIFFLLPYPFIYQSIICSTTNKSSVVIQYCNGSQDVFAVGKDNHIWHRWASPSGSWSDWNWFGNNTNFAPVTPTLIKYTDGSMDLIAIDNAGRLWHRSAPAPDWWSDLWHQSAPASARWSNWNWFGNNTNFAPAAPTLVKYADGSMDLITIDNAGHSWHRSAPAGNWWNDLWHPIGSHIR